MLSQFDKMKRYLCQGSAGKNSRCKPAVARPAAIVLRDSDEIIALGAIVAEEMFDVRLPVMSVGDAGMHWPCFVGRKREEA